MGYNVKGILIKIMLSKLILITMKFLVLCFQRKSGICTLRILPIRISAVKFIDNSFNLFHATS